LATIPIDQLVEYSDLDNTLGKGCSRYYCAEFGLRKKPSVVPRPDRRRGIRRKAKHVSSGFSTTSSEKPIRPEGHPVYLFWKGFDTCMCGRPIAVEWEDPRGQSPDTYTSDDSLISLPSLPSSRIDII